MEHGNVKGRGPLGLLGFDMGLPTYEKDNALIIAYVHCNCRQAFILHCTTRPVQR